MIRPSSFRDGPPTKPATGPAMARLYSEYYRYVDLANHDSILSILNEETSAYNLQLTNDPFIKKAYIIQELTVPRNAKKTKSRRKNDVSLKMSLGQRGCL